MSCITVTWNLRHNTNNKTYLYNTNSKTYIYNKTYHYNTNNKTHEHQDKEYDTKTNTHKAKELSLGQSRLHSSHDQQVSTKSATYIQVELTYIYMKTTYNNTSNLMNHYTKLHFKTYPQ